MRKSPDHAHDNLAVVGIDGLSSAVAWRGLRPGYLINWIHSPDYRSVDYTTGGTDPMLLNVRLADRRVETITSLKGLHRATGPAGNTEIGVAPDGSPVFTRDIGTQEIYALTVKWP